MGRKPKVQLGFLSSSSLRGQEVEQGPQWGLAPCPASSRGAHSPRLVLAWPLTSCASCAGDSASLSLFQHASLPGKLE